MSRDCTRRVAAIDTLSGVGKGKDRAEHGPVERRMGPNEKRWLEAKNTLSDDVVARKTMEEIVKSVGPSGARS